LGKLYPLQQRRQTYFRGNAVIHVLFTYLCSGMALFLHAGMHIKSYL